MQTNNYWEYDDVNLRAICKEDLERHIGFNKKPDSVGQWYFDELLLPNSQDEIENSFKKTLKFFSKGDRRIFILEKENAYIGRISVWHADRKNNIFRYGLMLDEAYRGQGLAKKGLIVVLDYYFNELNYYKCAPTVYSFNKSSQHFHSKFGFSLEACLKEEIYTRGGYHDMLYYSLLRHEFNKLYSHGSRLSI